jgi:23S rRNA pseudouridine2605 synthase
MTKMRLNRFIARSGISSLRGADELIRQGRVSVNGTAISEMGVKIDPERDYVLVDDEPITGPKKKRYYLFFKPKGVVSTMMDPEGRTCIADFTKGVSEGLFPVGRLDYDADGLMLLTNDGVLANNIAHPSKKLPKAYQVKITGTLSRKKIEAFQKGIPIDGKRTIPCTIKPLEVRQKNAWYEVTLVEGRNRQLKKMFSYFHHRVLKIKRISIGPLSLEGMAPGEMRKLTPDELERLLASLGMKGER